MLNRRNSGYVQSMVSNGAERKQSGKKYVIASRDEYIETREEHPTSALPQLANESFWPNINAVRSISQSGLRPSQPTPYA